VEYVRAVWLVDDAVHELGADQSSGNRVALEQHAVYPLSGQSMSDGTARQPSTDDERSRARPHRRLATGVRAGSGWSVDRVMGEVSRARTRCGSPSRLPLPSGPHALPGIDTLMPARAVLITGAAGFIGSHLTDRCLERGWRVTAVDAFTEYYDEAVKRRNIDAAADDPRCTLIEGDLLELDLPELLDDVETVFHLAAQPGVRASWEQFDVYTRDNVTATQRLLHAATICPVDPLVIASSSSIYGDAERMPTPEDVVPRPVSPYGLTKVAAEQLAHVYWRNFGVPTVCLRYFSVYGPRQRPDMAFSRLIACALRAEAFAVYGDGEQTRDFTFVSDVVEATIASASRGRPGATYNIGGGERHSMNSAVEVLASLIGARIECRYEEPQRGDARDTAADIRRARRDLGFTPSHDFRAGLGAQLHWQRTAQPEPAGGSSPRYD
jgi:nucleoside-diphosphate-sugar epimerase